MALAAMRLAMQASRPVATSRRPARSRWRPAQWLSQPKVRLTVRCTTLPSASGGRSRPARRWWDAEDDLDVSVIDLDAPNHEAKYIALGRPVQNVEALALTTSNPLAVPPYTDRGVF